MAPEEALAVFDALPAVEIATLPGRWRGRGLPTGHPLDGLLEAYGWYGKEFLDAEGVHPLLFSRPRGGPVPVDPALAPVGLLVRAPWLFSTAAARRLFPAVRALRATRRPAARLREVKHRGVLTAAMVYDALPAIDVFRQAGPDTLLGVLDLRGLTRPFFFVLERDRPSE